MFGPLNWFYGKQLDSTPPKVTVSCSDHQQLGLVVQSQDSDSSETTAPLWGLSSLEIEDPGQHNPGVETVPGPHFQLEPLLAPFFQRHLLLVKCVVRRALCVLRCALIVVFCALCGGAYVRRLQRGCLCARWDAVQGASGTPARGGASCAYCRLACCESPLGLFCWYSFIWCCLIHSMVQFFGPLNWF